MITTIEEVAQLPIVVVLYKAGSSGEFLSHALTQSFDNMTPTSHHWENHNRSKYFDIFDRNLNSGFNIIDPDEVIRSVNLYLETNKPVNTTHVAMAHSNPNSIKFLQNYFPMLPVIEITIHNELSKKFTMAAAAAKIKNHNAPAINPLLIPGQSGSTFARHLLIEWEDICITDPKSAFYKISEFIRHLGNVEEFCNCINDYRNRNAELIKIANES